MAKKENKKKGNKKKRTFRTSVYVGMVNGKQKTIEIRAETPKELKKKADETRADVKKGKDVYNKALFGDWADKWYREKKVGSGISEKTLEEWTYAIKHLKRRFGKTELRKITLSDFQVFINELAVENPNTGKPASKKILTDVKNSARNIFRYAVANNISGVTDFFDSVSIPRDAPKKVREALTEEEQNYIIDTPHRAQLPAMIMLFSGLRRGECLALEWSDIDLKNGLIYINKSITFVSNKGRIKKGGKTENATRVVPIPPILINYLKEYKKDQKAISKIVCTKVGGGYHTKSSWHKLWEGYIQDLNLKYGYDDKIKKNNPKIKASELPLKIRPFTAHWLRHTFATILFLQDIDIVTAKQIVGHEDISTIVNIYMDLKNFSRITVSKEYLEKLEGEYKLNLTKNSEKALKKYNSMGFSMGGI